MTRSGVASQRRSTLDAPASTAASRSPSPSSRCDQYHAVGVPDPGAAHRPDGGVVHLVGEHHRDAAVHRVALVNHLHLGPVGELRDEARARDRVLRVDGDGDALHVRDGDHRRET